MTRWARWQRRVVVLVVTAALVTVAATLYIWERGRDHVTREGELVLLRTGEDPLRLLGLVDPRDHVSTGVGFSGTLTLVGGRCFGVEQPAGGGEVVLAWPDDTRMARRAGELGLVTSGTFIELGEEIEGGASVRRDPARFAGDLPAVCSGDVVVELALGE